MRKGFFYALILLMAATAVYAAKYFDYPGFHVSPDGLMLSHWQIGGPAAGPSPQLNHPKGKPVQVSFTLTNVADQPLLLTKMYVACRYSTKAEVTGAVESHDFGFMSNVLINPGGSKTLQASLPLDKVGTWRFWPAYEIGERKSPLRWHDFIIRVETKSVGAGASGGTQEIPGPLISPDQMKITHFRVSTRKNPKVGDYVVADFDLTNMRSKPVILATTRTSSGRLLGNGLYISCRANLPTVVEDFGFKHEPITLKPGETIHVHGARKLDKSGLWFLWPGYKVFGGNTVPFKWHDLDVVVQ